TEPPQSPAALVVSYTTVSPLPRHLATPGRSVFCGTVPRVTPGRRYRPPCPVEPGPSSTDRKDPPRPPGRLTQPNNTPPTTNGDPGAPGPGHTGGEQCEELPLREDLSVTMPGDPARSGKSSRYLAPVRDSRGQCGQSGQWEMTRRCGQNRAPV